MSETTLPTAHLCLTRDLTQITSLLGPPCTGLVPPTAPRTQTVCYPCRDKLIVGHTDMAYWFAWKLYKARHGLYRRIPGEDLGQLSLVALIECAQRYDPTKACHEGRQGRLGALLKWWVRNTLQRAVGSYNRAVSITYNVMRHRLSKHGGETDPLIAATLRIPKGEDSFKHLYTCEKDKLKPFRLREDYEQIVQIALYNDVTTPQERYVLIQATVEKRSYAAIGVELGMTKDQIRSIVNRVVGRAKRHLLANGIVR